MNDKLRTVLTEALEDIIQGNNIVLDVKQTRSTEATAPSVTNMYMVKPLLYTTTHGVEIDVFIKIYKKHFTNKKIKDKAVLDSMVTAELKADKKGGPQTGYLQYLLEWQKNDIVF